MNREDPIDNNNKVPLLMSLTETSLVNFIEKFKLYRQSPSARRLPSLITSGVIGLIELQEEALLAHVNTLLKNEIPTELGTFTFVPGDTVQKRLTEIQTLEKTKVDTVASGRDSTTSQAANRAAISLLDEKISKIEDGALSRIELLMCPLLTTQVAQKLQSIKMDYSTSCSMSKLTTYVLKFRQFCTLYKARLPIASALANIFADGLQPKELQIFVKQQNLSNWNEACQQALSQGRILEAMVRNDQPRFPPIARGNRFKHTTKDNHQQHRMKPTPPKSDQTCFLCGQKGHFKAACPKRDQGFAVIEGDIPEILAMTMDAKLSAQAPWIICTIKDNPSIQIRALLDSGATRNFINPRVVRKIEKGMATVERKNVKRSATIADNSSIVTTEDVLITMETPHGDITDWFSVCNIPGDVFIGYGTLVAYGIVKDMTKPQAKPPHTQNSGMKNPRTKKLLATITSKEEETLPKFEQEEDPDVVDMDCVGENQSGQKIKIGQDFPLQTELKKVLAKYEDVLSEKLPMDNKAGFIEIKVKDENEAPVVIPPRRTSLANEKVIEAKLQELLADKVIQPSRSQFSSPIVVVRKQGATPRLCIDYREINKRLIRPACPMKDTRTLIRNLQGNKFFGVLDLRSGFHQIKLTEESRKYTAFATSKGLFEFLRLPFGIAIAPQEFQRIMSTLLHGIPGVDVYVDDVIIAATTAEDFVSRVDETLKRLQEANLRVKTSKCRLGEQTITYLGHKVDGNGVQLTEDRRKAFDEIRRPNSTADVRVFLGMTNYFRQFIENFAVIAAPLNKLTKKNESFIWNKEQEEAFKTLKKKLVESPVLHHINYDHNIVVRTDACLSGIGGVLWQEENNSKRRFPVAYMSKPLTDQQTRWSAIEVEAYAIYHAITNWSEYLLGHSFVVETDHANLRYLEKSEAPKLVRWRLQLGNYDFTIRHVPGKVNELADGLSRLCIISDKEEGIPSSIIARYHNNIAGHLGVETTIRALRADGFDDKKLNKEVEAFIQLCSWCQKHKSGQPTVEFEQRPTATLTPWTHISVDTMGPLPRDNDGYSYIIVVVDRFSRYLELFAARDATARSAAKALLDVFGRYGPPLTIRSDNGPQFTAIVIEDFLRLLNVSHELTIAYRPQANGLVERQNQEILKHLRSLVHAKDVKRNWSMLLPLVARTINSAWHSAINNAPAKLILGNLASLQMSLLRHKGDDREPSVFEANKFLQEFVKAQSYILEASAKHQEEILLKLATKYGKTTTTTFEPGQYVLWKSPTKLDKLSLSWKGPFKVIGTNPELLSSLVISDVLTNKERTVHISTVKNFKYSDEAEVLKAAHLDKQSLDRVEKIVSHQMDEPSGIMMFKVRWAGYSPEEDTWEVWQTVQDLEAMEQYLREHPDIPDEIDDTGKKK